MQEPQMLFAEASNFFRVHYDVYGH
ncbi:hypothetical protein ID866_11698 [Astraeus odoratus]|nr:hypothetical protein ID866_11698 [Astraeus odoratus]